MTIRLLGIALFLTLGLVLFPQHARGVDDGLDTYDGLLSKYVTPQGVHYAAWRAAPEDMKALSEVVLKWTKADFGKLGSKGKYAAFINLYNAKILEIVLAGNPKTSIKDLSHGRFGYEIFYREVLDVQRKRISLNEIETRLREESKDPRVHFAINCASKSCPPIAPEAYRQDRLDAQLDRQADAFLRAPGALLVDKKSISGGKTELRVVVSKIFDWYAKDFEAVGGPLAFISRYGPEGLAADLEAAGSAAKLDYQDYDWSLNQVF